MNVRNLEKTGIWSKAVIERDGKCCDCGRGLAIVGVMHAMRLDRTKPLVPENGVAICGYCRQVRYEKRAKVRIRSGRPQRKTLLARIKELEAALAAEKQKRRGERFPNPWPQE